jgi:hypothetical protein
VDVIGIALLLMRMFRSICSASSLVRNYMSEPLSVITAIVSICIIKHVFQDTQPMFTSEISCSYR